jgi:hypothetical protein
MALPSDWPADDAWTKRQAWKSLNAIPHLQTSDSYEADVLKDLRFPASPLAKKEMAPLLTVVL